MKTLILGGGAQGKATLLDLTRNKEIQITIADNNTQNIKEFIKKQKIKQHITIIEIDANNKEELKKLFKKNKIVIDLLPTIFRKHITEIAIETKTNLVNTSFSYHIEELSNQITQAKIIIMPEAGLDPGIDLILAGEAKKRFDEITHFASACGGVPTKEACDNPLNYKISWNFEGVLSAYKRPANIIEQGNIINIEPEELFNYSEEIEIETIGKMEMYPNGYSTRYAETLELNNVPNVARYTLRWPGHSDFWKKIIQLGIIDDEPILGISPKQYLAKVLESKLQYKENEKDLVVLRNEVKGKIKGKEKTLTQTLIDTKDKTGLMAMNRTVGFTASIIAQIILNKKITKKGLLNPAKDIPYPEFIKELKKRKIKIKETLK